MYTTTKHITTLLLCSRVKTNIGCLQMPQDGTWIRKSKMRTMLICFFDSHRMVHRKFVAPGQTVNQTYYREVLDRLRKRVKRLRPDTAQTWIFHHDDTSVHNAFSVTKFLTSKGIVVLPQLQYSPDLSLCDFFLFRKAGGKRNVFSVAWRDLKGCDEGIVRHSDRSFSELLRRVEKLLELLCCCIRDLSWKWSCGYLIIFEYNVFIHSESRYLIVTPRIV